MALPHFFDAPPASPSDILNNREARVLRQQSMLARGYSCLICFTLNIPGSVKQFSYARRAFSTGLDELRRCFSSICDELLTENITGSEAILALSMSPREVKQQTILIEEHHPLGRIFDIDVLDSLGQHISRAELGLSPRPCFLCGRDARLCGRSRAHSPELLQLYVAQLLNDYFCEELACRFTSCVSRAMLQEVSVTPKPGLVDRSNAGSHQDMDFSTFMDSAGVLSSGFHKLFRIGWNSSALSFEALFHRLRMEGQRIERAMLSVTGGVNTHKGLLFSGGFLCGAAGFLYSTNATTSLCEHELLQLCRTLGTFSLSDFEVSPNNRTFPLSPGARGELANGFPAVFSVGLPTLETHIRAGRSLNDSAALTLLALIAHVEDTNMLRRGGEVSAAACQAEAVQLLRRSPEEALSALSKLDGQYQMAHLSPGGCADLLSITLAFYFLRNSGLIL